MNRFTWNLLLALLWAVVTGSVTVLNLALGFLLGYVVLALASPFLPPSKYHTRLWQAIAFILFYIRELFLSSLRVAHDVITPAFYMRPGVIAVPLEARTDLEITLLAHLISLTPGSLSLDVSTDRRVLYIHAMYIDTDVEALRREIKHNLERRVLELLR